MTLLRLTRFIRLSMGKSLLPIANRGPKSWRKSYPRRAMGGMKKTSVIEARSSNGALRGGGKPDVDIPPPQPSIVLPSTVPGGGNSDRISLFLGTSAPVMNIEKGRAEHILAESTGSCSRVGKKRKISRLQKAKENLKKMKEGVKKQREERNRMRQLLMEETSKMQSAEEVIQLALAQGRAENELMMEQNLQDQHLLMLGFIYILDADDGPIY